MLHETMCAERQRLEREIVSLQARLKELLQEQRAIDFYLRHHNIILMPAMRNTYYLRILYIQNFFRPILLPNHRNFKNGWRSLTKAIRLIRSSVFIRRVQVFLCVPNQKR